MLRGRPPRALRPTEARRQGRDRDELDGTQVEGLHAVRELLVARRRQVRELLVAEGRSAPLAEVLELARAARVPVRVLSGEELALRARTEAPQGVVARAEPLHPVELSELLSKTTPAFVLVCDELVDPQNFGAVLRSALGAGADGVVIGKRRQSRVTPAATKAAAGAIEHLPIALVPGIPAALSELSRRGLWCVGLDGKGEEVLDELAIFDQPLALVVGSEGAGLSKLAAARCDVRARIPLAGPIPSLNAAAAAAVALFSVARVRRATPAR